MTKMIENDNNDPGYQLIPVARLRAVCDPFLSSPWEEVASISVEDVQQALNNRLDGSKPYSKQRITDKSWNTADHIARIAYLVAEGWDDPIEVDVGVPHLGCWMDWMVTDGNHRLAAAIVREDEFILASIAGSCEYMIELFGEMEVAAPEVVG
jgi:hypothetical protein